MSNDIDFVQNVRLRKHEMKTQVICIKWLKSAVIQSFSIIYGVITQSYLKTKKTVHVAYTFHTQPFANF